MQNVGIIPKVVHRECGGWIAYPPPDAGIRIGVTAESEDAARSKYMSAIAQWRLLLARDAPQPS